MIRDDEHGIHKLTDIESIGHRVVHGADIFHGPAQLTDEVIRTDRAIRRSSAAAPFSAVLDHQRNREVVDHEGAITTPDSSLRIWVIPTEEGLMIAKDVADWFGSNRKRAGA